jgi:regulator of protease activity HflC (stomatin/prohibitin superfamily)
MKMGFGALLAIILALIVVASMSLFTVDQRERAIVFRLGEITEIIDQPGLHVKWPSFTARAIRFSSAASSSPARCSSVCWSV